MKAGIIAAGEGRRLREAGIDVPKPLIPILGKPLVERIITSMAKAGAESVACIVNAKHHKVTEFLRSNKWPIPLELVVKSTPSSMESLFQLAPLLAGEPFILSTVDVVFDPKDLEQFVHQALSYQDAAGILAITDYVDDEKPLWVKIDSAGTIVSLGERALPTAYVTAGIYYLTPAIFELVAEARSHRLGALRQFLSLLVECGYVLKGIPISKAIDVDHPEDIQKAEEFLKEIGGEE